MQLLAMCLYVCMFGFWDGIRSFTDSITSACAYIQNVFSLLPKPLSVEADLALFLGIS